MRRIPDEAVNAVTFCPAENTAATTVSYDISLLTPMFGGDTKPWEPNKQRPIRESSVKGHLRFWWRTMQDEDDIKNLRKRENKLFGATGGASRVTLRVQHDEIKLLKNLSVLAESVESEEGIMPYPAYVLFPLSSKENNPSDYRCVANCRFTLTITMHGLSADEQAAVSNTVKLWVLFGGVGARTRRGCGSLYCPQIADSFTDAAAVRAFLLEVTRGQSIVSRLYPRLAGAVFAWASGGNDSIAAWEALLSRYKRLRQARNPGYGRSHWPEPDAIRRITGQQAAGHIPEHIAGNWFPKGAFGMPVQFQFRTDRHRRGDPDGKPTLLPSGRERWASPVILKVLRFTPASVCKACLILNQVIPKNLSLVDDNGLDYRLSSSEHPDAYAGKETLMGDKATIPESPYDTLVRKLGLTRI